MVFLQTPQHIKFLMVITPQGAISFLFSKGWGGRVTDKHVTEHCGFLSYILPGDVVLADRGLIFKILSVANVQKLKFQHSPGGKISYPLLKYK